MKDYDGFLFGCPAMGAEVLEEAEFEPFFQEAETKLSGIPVGLFGSYGWGGGEWMETWHDSATDAGVNVIDCVIANLEPDDEAIEKLTALGKRLAE